MCRPRGRAFGQNASQSKRSDNAGTKKNRRTRVNFTRHQNLVGMDPYIDGGIILMILRRGKPYGKPNTSNSNQKIGMSFKEYRRSDSRLK
ncbi:MAG: hypothetical protein JWM16_3844 [Verrucomicrobiales bacterium]|nr:hypothetical protein [Verrucomicrobiales bacterium]